MKIIVGGKGKMGSLIQSTAESMGHEVLALVDTSNVDVLDTIDVADVIIDFSHRDNLDWIANYVAKNHCALVYGTTGLEDEQKKQLESLQEVAPIFFSANYSYGIAVLRKTLAVMAPLLKESFDMEVVETHHNQKADAPSGTAKAILETIDPENEYKKVYGREGMTGKRQKEIGVHALRGGTEAGEHTVHFFGDNESLSITHHATNRQIFVNGALKAAEFIVQQPNGFYDMEDLVG